MEHLESVLTAWILKTSGGILRLKKESPSLETLCECSQFARDLYSIFQPLRTADLFQCSASAIATWHSLHYEFARATLLVSPVNEVPALKDASAYVQSDSLYSTYTEAQTEASQKISSLLFGQYSVYMQMLLNVKGANRKAPKSGYPSILASSCFLLLSASLIMINSCSTPPCYRSRSRSGLTRRTD